MKSTRRHSKPLASFEVDGPAVVTPLHARDRELSKTAGGPRAWRKLTVLQQAFLSDRLGAQSSDIARDRYAAGVQYTEWHDRSQRASSDSTARIDAGRSMGSGAPMGEASRAALARLEVIEKHLGRNDRHILRSVCCHGYTIAEAMVAVRLPKETRVSARFCEALDALIDAIERTERRGRSS